MRLAARLTQWDIDILTPPEYQKGLDDMEKSLKAIEIEEGLLDRMVAMGLINLLDIDEVGYEPLVKELELSEELAKKIVEHAAVDVKRVAIEDAAKKVADEQLKKEKAAADAAAAGAAAAAAVAAEAEASAAGETAEAPAAEGEAPAAEAKATEAAATPETTT